MHPKPDGRRTNGGARRGAGRKPQGARIVGSELRLSIGHYTPAQRETLIALINAWLAQAKGETK